MQSTRHVRKENRIRIAKYKTCQEREQDNNCTVQDMSGKRPGCVHTIAKARGLVCVLTGFGTEVTDLPLASRHYLAMKRLIEENNFDGLAIRCWPELPGPQVKKSCLQSQYNEFSGNFKN